MTLSLLDLGNGPSSPTPGPRWPHIVGAVLVAAALLFAGPLRCTAPLTVPPRIVPDGVLSNYATTWSHPSNEGNAG